MYIEKLGKGLCTGSVLIQGLALSGAADCFFSIAKELVGTDPVWLFDNGEYSEETDELIDIAQKKGCRITVTDTDNSFGTAFNILDFSDDPLLQAELLYSFIKKESDKNKDDLVRYIKDSILALKIRKKKIVPSEIFRQSLSEVQSAAELSKDFERNEAFFLKRSSTNELYIDLETRSNAFFSDKLYKIMSGTDQPISLMKRKSLVIIRGNFMHREKFTSLQNGMLKLSAMLIDTANKMGLSYHLFISEINNTDPDSLKFVSSAVNSKSDKSLFPLCAYSNGIAEILERHHSFLNNVGTYLVFRSPNDEAEYWAGFFTTTKVPKVTYSYGNKKSLLDKPFPRGGVIARNNTRIEGRSVNLEEKPRYPANFFKGLEPNKCLCYNVIKKKNQIIQF